MLLYQYQNFWLRSSSSCNRSTVRLWYISQVWAPWKPQEEKLQLLYLFLFFHPSFFPLHFSFVLFFLSLPGFISPFPSKLFFNISFFLLFSKFFSFLFLIIFSCPFSSFFLLLSLYLSIFLPSFHFSFFFSPFSRKPGKYNWVRSCIP